MTYTENSDTNIPQSPDSNADPAASGPRDAPRNPWPALFAAALALSALVFLGMAFDPFDPIKTFVLRTFCAGVVLAGLGDMLILRRTARIRTAADLPWVLFLAWILVSFVYAGQKFFVFDAFMRWVCQAVLFFGALHFFHTRRQVETLILGVLSAAVVVAVLGALELRRIDLFPWDTLLVNPLYSVFSGYDSKGVIPLAWMNQFDGRISSSIGNPVYVAGYAVVLLPPALALFLGARRPLRIAFCFTSIVALMFTLTATFTRSAWASCALSLVLFSALAMAYLPAQHRRAAALRLCAAAAAGLLIFALFSFRNPMNTGRFTAAQRAVEMPGTHDLSAMQRTLIWKTTWRMIRAHPVRGAGAGQFFRDYPRYTKSYFHDSTWRPHISFPDRAHNDLLELWAEIGTPGLLLALSIIFAVFLRGPLRVREARATDSRTALLSAGLASGLAGMLFYSNFQFPFHVPAAAAHFWVFAGLLLVLSERVVRKRETIPPASKDGAISGGAMVTVLLIAIFGACMWLAAQPVVAHLLFGRGVALENHFRDAEPETTLDLMDTARRTYAYETEMCAEMMRVWLAHGNAESLPDNTIRFYAAVAQNPDLGKWRPLWQGRLPDRAPAPPWGRTVPLKVFYYANAVRTANQCLLLNPNDPRPWAALGRAQFEMRMPAQAVAAYETALVFSPDSAEYLHALGDAYLLLGRFADAEIQFRKALLASPDFLPALFSLGAACDKQGQYDEAAVLYNSALKRNPDNAFLWKALGKTYMLEGDDAKARHAMERAVALNPNFLEAAGDLAVLLYNTGNTGKGIALLKDIINKAPGGSELQIRALYHLGEAYRTEGNRDQAVSAYRRAAELSPEVPLFRDKLDEVLDNDGINRTQ